MMKIRPKNVSKALSVLFIFGVGFTACGSDHAATSGAFNTNATSDSRNDGGTLADVYCKNPIPLEIAGQTPLMGDAKLPQGKFNLVSMKIYDLSPDKGSFIAEATTTNQFQVNVSCNGMKDPGVFDTHRSWTDSDGGQHEASDTHSSSTSADFSAGDSIDTANPSHGAGTLRKIAVKFENGKLVNASSSQELSGQQASTLQNLPTDRIQISTDTFLQIRVYSSSENEFEIRLEFEFPADQNGKRVLEYAQAKYQRVN